eukprot:4481485-Prymnesium_polylepis.1
MQQMQQRRGPQPANGRAATPTNAASASASASLDSLAVSHRERMERNRQSALLQWQRRELEHSTQADRSTQAD